MPEGNAAKVGIYYDGNKSIDAEISGGKVTAYGTKCGIYKVNLIMSGTGSVYATGGTYGIGQTVPTIDEDEFVVKGSTEFKAEESSVTANAEFNSGYYEIGGADAKTVVIKPDTSPRIILGNQIGIFKTEEYEIIEDMDMTDIKLKGTVYFDITLKNMSDEEFADARGCFGGDEPDLLASIIKTDYGWVCMVCDTEFSVTYDTDNTLTIKCGDIVSNTVQVKSNANRFNKVTQGDNTNRTVFYTNTSQEEKDNYKLVSTYTVDSESISYNWYSTNSAYSADELGAAVSGSNGEFKLADNIPAGNYVLYCDITYSDGDSTETVTENLHLHIKNVHMKTVIPTVNAQTAERYVITAILILTRVSVTSVSVSLLLQSAQTAVRRQAVTRSQTALTALLPIPETMLRSIRISAIHRQLQL